MQFTKQNQTDNKAQQTRPQDNEKHTNADKINTNYSTTCPKPDEILSISKERDINKGGQFASTITIPFSQNM